ncbi:baseplate J/gp47 family protein [Trichocoleus desertorum AS-A10]|uniref:baseplate J/gp47 family protein n=1 Tax=Trichocoleus desertorum TaxID=1481672 RepID=UPI00329773EF
MSPLTPKIDQRTYDSIVAQTAMLVEAFTKTEGAALDGAPMRTGWKPPGAAQVSPTIDALMGRLLDQELIDPQTSETIAWGTLIDAALAERIIQIPGLEQVSVWSLPNSKVPPDAGWTLIRIFSHLATLVRDRLNQVPEKNFLAFLNLIGTQILPPQPARVPLTFYLVENSTVDALVPAQTQIAALPVEGATEEVVFETERDVLITPAQLQAAFVHQPDIDAYSDRTAIATGQIDSSFPAFVADQPTEHSFYLACDALLTLPGSKTVILTFDSPQGAQLASLPVTWSFWHGTRWQPIESTSGSGDLQWTVTLRNLPPLTPHPIDGQVAGWLRAELASPLRDTSTRFQIQNIQARLASDRENLSPDHYFFNTTAIDTSKDFYPFGEQPRFNDTLYLASQEVFSQSGTQVTVKLKLNDDYPPKTDGGVAIQWEAWNGETWQIIKEKSVGISAANFTSDTSGVVLRLPAVVAAKTVNGGTNYWIRARLVKGHYGEITSVQPPLLQSLKLSYTASTSSPISACRVYHQLTYLNPLASDRFTLAQDRKAGEKTLRLHQVDGLQIGDRLRIEPDSAREENHEIASIDVAQNLVILTTTLTGNHNHGSQVLRDFQPFPPIADTDPTLYLGFDRPFTNRTIALYLQIDAPSPGAIANSNSSDYPAQLIWEYRSPGGWASLGMTDETGNLKERGLIRFIGPSDFAAHIEFGRSLYWLRCRWQAGDFRVHPQLHCVLTNTTWAVQATTVIHEMLGPSNGNPDQMFRTSQTPVLLGQALEVQEATLLAAKGTLPETSLTQEMTVVQDELGTVEAVWVRWQEVPDFYGSSAHDRHYVLDRLTGTLRFGNGQQGMMPPAGTNLLRLTYANGGGKHGNLPAQTITQLKTTIPYLDRVTNLEPAGGGADQEPLERVKERGPKALRHQQRAVTAQDMEDLAYEASSEVARAKAITPHFASEGLEWLPFYGFRMPASGPISVNLEGLTSASGTDTTRLKVQIHGPGQASPYASQEAQRNQTLEYLVTDEDLALGVEWSVMIVNLTDNLITGALTITYPGGSLNESLSVPAQGQPHVEDAGRVDLLIVPSSSAQQPTPSLGLLDRVEAYIRDRCTPTLDLRITEPVWVEITVITRLVPTSFAVSDAARAAAIQALTQFLHPLLGGVSGQGWAFGRRPHKSDLYAVLEAIPTIDHVEDLSIVSIPSLGDDLSITPLDPSERDRFLIFSGKHQVTLLT